MTAIAAYRGVLAIREARALISASAASQIGDWLYNAALLAYVFSETHSAAWVGAATLCRLLPYVLLGPYGGVLADRYPRRTVLLVGDLVRMALMLVLAAAVAADGGVTIVIVIAALSSAAGSAERPAATALLPRLVGEARIGPANALLHTVQDFGIVVGPAIGAVLLAVAGAPTAFLANAATFAGSALLIAMLQKRPAPATKERGAGTGILGGVRTARSTRFVLPLFLLVAFVDFTYGAQTVQLVIYADRSLDLGEGGYGLLLAAAGAGGLISAFVNSQLSTSRQLTLVLIGGAAIISATQLVYAVSDTVVLALAVTVLGGAALVSSEVVAETVLARVTPSETLGRIAGLFDAIVVAAMALAAVLASILVNATSLETSFWILGGGALLGSVSCVVGLRGLDEASRKRSEALAERLAIIERLPVTQGVPQLVLEQLASASQLAPLPPGVDVVVQGSPAHAFYAIASGQVVVHRDGTELVRRGPGESFGERGLLDNAPRNATVTTETDATLLMIEGDVLLEVLEAAPELTTALNRSPAGRGLEAPAAGPVRVDDPRWANA